MAQSEESQTDESRDNDTSVAEPVRLARGTVAAVTRFVARNGGSAKAVISPVGGAGVRVILVGSDGGTLGDQVVSDVEAATALVDAVEGLELAEWDRELSAAATPREGHYAKMAGWVART